MRRQKRAALTFLSARVELDEKDESCDALIFWWGRQICPPPWRCRKGWGGEARRCGARVRLGIWSRGRSVYRLSTVHGDARANISRGITV